MTYSTEIALVIIEIFIFIVVLAGLYHLIPNLLTYLGIAKYVSYIVLDYIVFALVFLIPIPFIIFVPEVRNYCYVWYFLGVIFCIMFAM
jgi:hypothetical protein